MKKALSINTISFFIFFLFLSSCTQQNFNAYLDGYCGAGNHDGSKCLKPKKLIKLADANEIEVCREYINRTNDNYLKEMQELIISRNIDCNKYSALLQNRQNNQEQRSGDIDWGAVANEIGKIKDRNTNKYKTQNNQIGEFCSYTERRNIQNYSVCYYECSKTGLLQIQIPYGSNCQNNFYR